MEQLNLQFLEGTAAEVLVAKLEEEAVSDKRQQERHLQREPQPDECRVAVVVHPQTVQDPSLFQNIKSRQIGALLSKIYIDFRHIFNKVISVNSPNY